MLKDIENYNKNIKLYSFDIFDTLITRKVPCPKSIFVLMQNVLVNDPSYSDINQDIKLNFAEYRVNCEYRTRRLFNINYNGKDTTLDEIYKEFQNTFLLSDEQIANLKELEIKTEIENIIPIQENIEKLKNLIKNGKRVVLISDMYLPEHVIKSILEKCDKTFKNIKLYLSSSVGYMKNNGKLFEYIKDTENVEYKEWLHIGDNSHSDYKCPKKEGINAINYNYVKLKEYENKLLEKDFYNPYVHMSLGCSKNIRLNNQSIKYQFGASFTAPIFYPYITWLLNQCISRNIKHLYFIARDGYILKLITDTIISKKKLDIKTSYIYGSRIAWRAPACDNEMLYRQFIKTAMWSYKNIDLQFGISQKDLVKLLPKKFKNYKKNLKNHEVKELEEFLINDKSILQKIIKCNKKQRENVIKYLKNNINTDCNFAFVDLTGSGFTQNCLANLMKSFYDKDIVSFYFASTPAIFAPIKVNRIYFSAIKIKRFANTLEVLTKAPHGQTLKYQENGSPVFELENKDLINSWGLNEYIEGILKYTKDYNGSINHSIINEYCNFIHSNIDKELADILGSIPHSFCGKENRDFAPKLNFFDAIKYLLTNKLNTENINISAKRSNKIVNNIVAYKQKHPNLRKEIFNIFYSHSKKYLKITLFGINITINNKDT